MVTNHPPAAPLPPPAAGHTEATRALRLGFWALVVMLAKLSEPARMMAWLKLPVAGPKTAGTERVAFPDHSARAK